MIFTLVMTKMTIARIGRMLEEERDDGDEEEGEYETFEVGARTHLYLLHYKLYGRNDKLLVELENYYIGCDITEIIDEIKYKLLGVEINTKGEDGKDFHEVPERLQVLNAELIAPIHGLTSASLKVFAEYYKDIRQELDEQE